MSSEYKTCANYCTSVGMVCVNAYEEVSNNCVEETQHACEVIVHGSLNAPSSDVICECRPLTD